MHTKAYKYIIQNYYITQRVIELVSDQTQTIVQKDYITQRVIETIWDKHTYARWWKASTHRLYNIMCYRIGCTPMHTKTSYKETL